ncbi:MAG: hypothetical protein SFU84_00155 [Gemmatimonadales bacterium]|nr:hypothetical protein [Gemmatimonadales bacterium]
MPRLALLLLFCAACTTAEVIDPTAEVALTPTVALDLSLGDGDSVLVGKLEDATRFPDGRIALLDVDRRAVVFLDSTGRTMGVVGRRGEGPGEFQFPSSVGRCQADSLYVWDRGLARVSIFSPTGSYVRELRPAVTGAVQPGCLPDGKFVALDASKVDGTPRLVDGVAPLLRGPLVVMTPDGAIFATVPDMAIGEVKLAGQMGGIALAGDRVVVGLSSSNQLTSFGVDGTPQGVDTVDLQPALLTDARFEALLERQARSTGSDSSMLVIVRRMLRAQGKPEMAPLFSSMHGAPDGTVWWVTSLPVDTTMTLVGFRPDAPRRTLTLPAGVEVFEFGADYLLGKRTDSEGLERLMLWRW